MLQAISSSISLMRQEMKDGFKKVNEKVKKGFKEVSERIDNLGRDLAILDEDVSTGEEFRKLEKRVKKLEIKTL